MNDIDHLEALFKAQEVFTELVVRLPEGMAAGVDSAGSPFFESYGNNSAELRSVSASSGSIDSFSVTAFIRQHFQSGEDAHFGRFTIIYDASGM